MGWFPGAVAYDAARHRLVVANIKGVGSTRGLKESRADEYNTHQYHGTLSLVPVPRAKELPALTRRVLDNYRYPLLKEARQPARPNQPPRPVPERVGEPSVFEHVVYIIKENRTYDQVLGDIPEGNGDPSLCIFGAQITPNQHKMVRQFVLLDNIYCSGILSADGHQWSDSAFATDYMEKSFAGFPRSYPDGMEDNDVDALAYAPVRLHLGQRHRPRQVAARLRRIRHHGDRVDDSRQERPADVPGLLPRLRRPDPPDPHQQPARHRIAAALPEYARRSAGTWTSPTSSGPPSSSRNCANTSGAASSPI